MRPFRPTSGMLITAFSALCFSTLPIFGIYAYRAGANVVTVLGVRFALAAAVLWLYLFAVRRPLPGWRISLFLLLMGGAGYSTMSMLYLSAVEGDRLSPSLAAMLLYTYPAIVALEAWLFDGLRLGWRQGTAMLLTLGGTAMVLLTPGGGASFTPLGALLALGAALVYGTYILFGSRVTRQTTPLAATTLVTTAAATVFLVLGGFSGSLVRVAPAGWWAMAGMAFIATVLAVIAFFSGLERVGPAQASIISTLEPVGTAVLSLALFGDRLSGIQAVGGLLVLFGIIWLQVTTRG